MSPGADAPVTQAAERDNVGALPLTQKPPILRGQILSLIHMYVGTRKK